METWLFALLFKPLAAMAFAVVYYFTVVKSVAWLLRTYPRNRFVVFLCRERGKYGIKDRETRSTGPVKPALQHVRH